MNLDNTCYINSVRQCLMSVRKFIEVSIEWGKKQQGKKEQPYYGIVREAFCGVSEALQETSGRPFSPLNFKVTLLQFWLSSVCSALNFHFECLCSVCS